MNYRNRLARARSLLACALAFLSLCAASAQVSAPKAIGVDEAVAMAAASDEGLRQSAISLEAKRRALAVSWNAYLPSIKASAGLSGTSAASSVAAGSLAATGSVSASLGIDAAIGDDRKLALLQYEDELLAYRTAKSKLELSVRKKACAVLLDAERLKLARQNIEREKASYSQTEAKYKAGLAPELDLLTAKVSLANSELKARGYETALADDLDAFRSLIGAGAEEDLTVSGSLEPSEAAVADLLAKAKTADASAGPGVAAADKALEIARLSKATLEKTSLLPSLSLSASATPSLPLLSSAGSSASLSLGASAMVSLSLDNYLAGSAARERIAQAQDSIDAAMSARKSAADAAAVSLKSCGRSVASCLSSLSALNLSVELASKAYDATKAAYDKGYATLAALQSAAGSLESAKLDTISKSYDLISAALDLEYATGLPLDTIGRFR